MTENCHAFVSHALNGMAYRGRRDHTMISLARHVFLHGRYVSGGHAVAAWAPFVLLTAIGLYVFGWAYAAGWLAAAAALLAWFAFYVYAVSADTRIVGGGAGRQNVYSSLATGPPRHPGAP